MSRASAVHQLIAPDVELGRNVTFINDRYLRATGAIEELKTEADWHCENTVIKQGTSIRSGTTLLGGITIGEKRCCRRGEPYHQRPASKYDCGGKFCPDSGNIYKTYAH